MKRIFALLTISVFSFTLLQCGNKTTEEGTVVAKVGDRCITQEDIDERVNIGLKQFGMNDTTSAQYNEFKETFSKEVKNSLIERAIFLENAKDNDLLEATDEKVTQQINQIKNNFPSEQEFLNYFTNMGYDQERLKKEIKEEFIINQVSKRLTAPIDSLSDDSLQSFYNSHQEDFRSEEKIRASHILVKVEESDTEEQKEEKRKKIDTILAKAKKGDDFAQLAQNNSDCPSGKNGGDLNYFGKGQMVPAFEEAAFALKKDEISDVVETNFGYHIIKLTDFQESKIQPYDSVKTKISGKMKEELIKDWLSAQKKEFDIPEEPETKISETDEQPAS